MCPTGMKARAGHVGQALVSPLVITAAALQKVPSARGLAWNGLISSLRLYWIASGMERVCADHGDCWGEDGLWEHGISHPATLTVPLLLRVRGVPVGSTASAVAIPPSPSRFRSAASRLKRWLKARL